MPWFLAKPLASEALGVKPQNAPSQLLVEKDKAVTLGIMAMHGTRKWQGWSGASRSFAPPPISNIFHTGEKWDTKNVKYAAGKGQFSIFR